MASSTEAFHSHIVKPAFLTAETSGSDKFADPPGKRYNFEDQFGRTVWMAFSHFRTGRRAKHRWRHIRVKTCVCRWYGLPERFAAKWVLFDGFAVRSRKRLRGRVLLSVRPGCAEWLNRSGRRRKSNRRFYWLRRKRAELCRIWGQAITQRTKRSIKSVSCKQFVRIARFNSENLKNLKRMRGYCRRMKKNRKIFEKLLTKKSGCDMIGKTDEVK